MKIKIFPKIDKQFFARYVLFLAIISQFLPVFEAVGKYAFYKTIQTNFILSRSYVSEIKGDMQSVNSAKKSLDYFNSLGNNEIIKFDKPDTLFTRDITIEVREFTFYEELLGLAGYAVPTPTGCTIVMYPWEDVTMFEQVLIHEYLHCMGYIEHHPDEEDVMYYAYRPVTELNLRKYAKQLQEKLK